MKNFDMKNITLTSVAWPNIIDLTGELGQRFQSAPAFCHTLYPNSEQVERSSLFVIPNLFRNSERKGVSSA